MYIYIYVNLKISYPYLYGKFNYIWIYESADDYFFNPPKNLKILEQSMTVRTVIQYF
jgi:hypothetical protein